MRFEPRSARSRSASFDLHRLRRVVFIRVRIVQDHVVASTAETWSRVLVLVKATPQPSARYGDTVCVAGVDLDSSPLRWLRLYPVPFRYLSGESQFSKYQVVRVRVRDAGADHRPESRKINAESIQVGRTVPPWSQRAKWVEPLVRNTMCAVLADARADLNATSLAAVRPRGVPSLTFERHPGWSASEQAKLDAYRNQGQLFSETSPSELEPPQYIVRMHYRCLERECAGHEQRILDWELTALQAKYKHRSELALKKAVTTNFVEIPFGRERAPLIFVGNQENVQRRASFTVLGLYYPRHTDVDQTGSLF